VVVDCRYALADSKWGGREYEKGHLPGALYADLNVDLSGPIVNGITGRHPLPDADKFVNWVGEAGIRKESQVIVYDQGGGGIAARLWWLMRWIGHDAVAVINGGWGAWLSAGLPVETDVRVCQMCSYSPSLRSEMVASLESIQKISEAPTNVLVDSRDERRYAGIEEPIDPVAGHIPGAINIPFAGNIDSGGLWRTSAELQNRFRHLTADHNVHDVIFYCGSGVTACHNILAFKHAELGDAKLYAGSWSEWIADPAREIGVPKSIQNS
jgi:thiosulfate/3-mercaptopyruvate sulfurtransferase